MLEEVLNDRGHATEHDDGALVVALEDSDPAQTAAAIDRAAFDRDIVLVEVTHQRTTLEDRYLSLLRGGTP